LSDAGKQRTSPAETVFFSPDENIVSADAPDENVIPMKDDATRGLSIRRAATGIRYR